jgi:hypothetical protein
MALNFDATKNYNLSGPMPTLTLSGKVKVALSCKFIHGS